ncbi:MAG: EF-hand domain-containing protein [Planctomycetota bacterium]|jgi:Ca2+-binding EF-hand superfamily protein
MRTIPLFLLVLGGLALGQGRGRGDPWERMQRYDENKDGKVTKEEFGGPERMFDRLDANKDGVVTKAEAKGMRRRGGGGTGTNRVLALLDTDRDGDVSRSEWDAFFKKADENDDGILQKPEMEAALSGRKLHDPAPKVGDAAPKVSAVSLADKRKVDLSKPKRTTVLVFGSWT